MLTTYELQGKMLRAIDSGDVAEVRRLATSDPNIISECCTEGALSRAAGEGQLEVCKEIVSWTMDINSPTPEHGNNVAICDAAQRGHLDVVKWFIENGALIDGPPTTVCTPLMAAAIEGHLEIVRCLLDAGAEINREHLNLPQTALDFAVLYRVKNTGQDAVATLLRERGGIRPYTEVHDWSGVPGQRYIEHIERAIGAIVNPLTAGEGMLSSGNILVIRKIRIPITPTKFDYQLLFTVGLLTKGFELALCLPSAWPLNLSSLKESRFAWPIEFLKQISTVVANGSELVHGDLINVDSSSLTDVGIPENIKQWVVSINQQIEAEREDDILIPRTLILSPIASKKPVKPGAETLALADKRQAAKWKALSSAV